MSNTFKSGLRYTEAERQADDIARQRQTTEGLRRKRAAPHGRYAVPGNPATKARDLRILGESDESGV